MIPQGLILPLDPMILVLNRRSKMKMSRKNLVLLVCARAKGSKMHRLGIYIIDKFSVAISITKRTGDYEIRHGFEYSIL